MQAAGIFSCRYSVKLLSSHSSKAAEIFRRPHRLLEPVESQVLEPMALRNGFRNRPGTIRVQHDLGVGTRSLDCGCYLLDSDFMQFYIPVAPLNGSTRRFHDSIDRAVSHQTGVGFEAVDEGASEQPMERRAAGFAEEVPQRNIDGSDSVLHPAVPAEIM